MDNRAWIARRRPRRRRNLARQNRDAALCRLYRGVAPGERCRRANLRVFSYRLLDRVFRPCAVGSYTRHRRLDFGDATGDQRRSYNIDDRALLDRDGHTRHRLCLLRPYREPVALCFSGPYERVPWGIAASGLAVVRHFCDRAVPWRRLDAQRRLDHRLGIEAAHDFRMKSICERRTERRAASAWAPDPDTLRRHTSSKWRRRAREKRLIKNGKRNVALMRVKIFGGFQ